MDPIQYPTVKIDGIDVEVKFRCGDIIRMKKNGLDIGDTTPVKGAEAMERTLTFLQHGIAHQMKKTVDELADAVNLADLPVIALAVTESIKKVSPQAAQALAQLTAMATEAKKTTETVQ